MNPLRLSRTYVGAMGLLTALVFSACLLVSGLPRAMEASYDHALSDVLSQAEPRRSDLTTSYQALGEPDELHSAAEFAAADRRLRSHLTEPLRSLVSPGAAGHFGLRTPETTLSEVVGGGGIPGSFVGLAWLSGAEPRVRWVAGSPPGEPKTFREAPLFEIGLVKEAAEQLNLPVGTTMLLNHAGTVAVRVTGLFEVRDSGDRYWGHNDDLRRVRQERTHHDGREWHITGLLSEKSVPAFTVINRQLTYSWTMATDPARAAARAAPDVLTALEDFRQEIILDSPAFREFYLDTDLGRLLTGYLGELATAQTVMYVVLGGLLVVALGVIVLALQLLVDRSGAGLSLTRARGGSLRQVAGAGSGMVALGAIPAAVAGYGLSWLVAGPVTAPVHAGPVLITLATLVCATVLLALRHRSPQAEGRDDVVARRPSPRRLTVEAVTVVLAVAGAYLLRSRGLTTEVAEQGADPFLLLVPLALAVAVALVTLRCYPFPLRLLVRLAARGARAVPFLGLAMAARSRSFTVLPVLIMLPALAVSVFAAVVGTDLSAAQRLAAWQEAGADVRLQGAEEIAPETIERIRRAPGVEQVVPARLGPARDPVSGQYVTMIAIDLAAYRGLVAETPLTVPATGGTTQGFPGLPTFGSIVVVPYEKGATMLYVRGSGLDAAGLAAMAGGQAVTYAHALREIQDRPLTATVQTVSAVATVALTVYALLAVVLALVSTSAYRARALSFLHTLGLSARQGRRLTALAIAPIVLLTVLAGLALGLGLPAALGPAIDLSAYAGD